METQKILENVNADFRRQIPFSDFRFPFSFPSNDRFEPILLSGFPFSREN